MTTDHDLTYRQQVIDRLAAINDGQAEQTGLLTDLRGAIDDLAETLRPKGDPCPCGCRRDVEPKPHVHFWKRQQNVTSRGYAMDPIEVCECGVARKADPEPESVTVTLPRDVAEPEIIDWRATAKRMRTEGGYECTARLLDALADALDAANTPPKATSAPLTAQEPTEAPEGTEGTERPTGANLRVGWLSALGVPPRLAREITDGWTYLRTDDGPVWGWHDTDIVFTPLTPADFGWTVLADDEVAVKREDVGFALHAMRAARHETESPKTEARLRDALDAASATQEADQGERVAQGHKMLAYGQGSHDGWFCKGGCNWQTSETHRTLAEREYRAAHDRSQS